MTKTFHFLLNKNTFSDEVEGAWWSSSSSLPSSSWSGGAGVDERDTTGVDAPDDVSCVWRKIIRTIQ